MILGLSLVFAIATVRPSAVHAWGKLLVVGDDEVHLESRCEIQRINGKFSSAGSEYSSRGRCVIYRISAGAIQDVANTIKWEATGKYNPAMKASEENIHLLRLVRPDQPNYASIGRISASPASPRKPDLP
jgi:hypothetical protein